MMREIYQNIDLQKHQKQPPYSKAAFESYFFVVQYEYGYTY